LTADGAIAAAGVSAVIIAFNEAVHIGRCIERVRPLASRIVVVDSFSTDGTVEIARSLGAEVLQNRFVNHAAQFEWGVKAAGISEGWILRIDADEYLEPPLIEEIRERLSELPQRVGAIAMRRKVYFQGRWIRWGGYYPIVLTRLWRAGAAHVEQRWMDEHVVVDQGETLQFRRGDLVDENLKDLTWWTDKHNGYTTRQMIEFISLEYPLMERHEDPSSLNSAARRKRMLRNVVYARSPLYLRALLYFLQRYFLRLGFLDGKRGFLFHCLQGFWNQLLIDAKIGEARAFIARNGLDAFREQLATRHGIRLAAPADPADRKEPVE
jgi:glycosyltransferase involved in cell wall biosynthesis